MIINILAGIGVITLLFIAAIWCMAIYDYINRHIRLGAKVRDLEYKVAFHEEEIKCLLVRTYTKCKCDKSAKGGTL